MTKRELAYQYLHNDIFYRTLPPGSHINISDLAGKYNMSTIPIREALTLLENENMVKNTPYCGYVVSNMVFSDFMEYSLTSGHLECLALQFGAFFFNADCLQNIKNLQDTIRRLSNSNKIEQIIVADHSFHTALFSFAPCENLKSLINDVRKKCYYNRSVLLLIPNRVESSIAEHDTLIQALEMQDIEKASRTLFLHRINTLSALIQEMKLCLAKPEYIHEEILTTFFSDKQLENRMAITGEVEFWNMILTNLANNVADAQK